VKLTHNGGAMVVLLPKECLVFEVEAHADLAVAAGWDTPELEEVVIDAGAVAAMDTAYFQLILAMRRSALKRDKTFRVRNPSPAMKEIADLYGLPLWQGT